MATRKPTSSRSKQAPQPQPQKLVNLAARKQSSFDDALDEQPVDASGVFRVTSAIQQAQIGHDEEAGMRFASDSLVMQAQRDGFRDDGPTIDEAVEEHAIDDETQRAERRARLATLAARARQTKKPRR